MIPARATFFLSFNARGVGLERIHDKGLGQGPFFFNFLWREWEDVPLRERERPFPSRIWGRL